MDRLTRWVVLLIPLAATACGSGGRPERLLDGRPAATVASIEGSVVASGRVLQRAAVGGRLETCAAHGGADFVERVGVDNESVTFAAPDGSGVYACDGGVDPAGERPLPWCGLVFGERVEGRLLDPRLDLNCRDRDGKPLAYAFVEPLERARWIGVARDGFVELHKVLAGLPVRIATTSHVSVEQARASFDVEQFDATGRLLERQVLEAAVAG